MIPWIAKLKRTALAGAIVLVCTAGFGAEGAPCIDTNAEGSIIKRTMAIQLPDGHGETHVTGTITAIYPTTGEVGVSTFGVDSEQRIMPTLIRLDTVEPSMAAQMALPVRTQLGPFSGEFSFAQLTVNQGIIRHPNCTSAANGHEIAFVGTLIFGDGKLKVNGTFSDYTQPTGGVGAPGIFRGKPG